MDFFTFCEDEAIKVALSGSPVQRFFSPEKFLQYGADTLGDTGETCNQIIDMPIADFLALAEPIPADDEKRHAPLSKFKQEVADGKKTDWDIPMLELRRNEDGIWKVVGHDGRHRAMLLKSLGYEVMPVRLMVGDCHLCEELMPDIIWCQNDKNIEREVDYLPFPLTPQMYGIPYLDVDFVKLATDKAVTDEASDAEGVGRGRAPEPCVQAKKNFLKNYVANVAYRKDNVMPASNLKEYMRQHGHTGFVF